MTQNNRLFIGNFQVAFLKKWIEKGDHQEQSVYTDNEQALPSNEAVHLSTLRKRGAA